MTEILSRVGALLNPEWQLTGLREVQGVMDRDGLTTGRSKFFPPGSFCVSLSQRPAVSASSLLKPSSTSCWASVLNQWCGFLSQSATLCSVARESLANGWGVGPYTKTLNKNVPPTPGFRLIPSNVAAGRGEGLDIARPLIASWHWWRPRSTCLVAETHTHREHVKSGPGDYILGLKW